MAPIQVASAFVPITGDNSFLKRTLADTKNMLNNFVGNVVQGIGQGIGQAVFGAINKAITAGLGLVKESIAATSDLNESLSKTVVAFGDSAKTILDWSKTSATALGQSRQQALEAASSFGLLFSSMGLASDESAEMSIGLVQLATDIASINNIDIEDALLKLRSGLVGETEPLRTVGVLLNAVAVEQEALTSGLAESKEAITEQDKVFARYNLILKQTAKSQGDFARTSEGIANQERILTAQRADALANIGQAFAPIYLVILQNINKLIGQISPYGENIIRALAEGMVNGIIYILPAVRAVREIISYWFKPGSPPRVLPDLVKWGASAMGEYLKGWGEADFNVLRNLGSTIEGIVRSFVTAGKLDENDVVTSVFGTRTAIAAAVAQWRNAGQVTQDSLDAIQTAAGPAGESLAGLVGAYFDMEGAARRAAAAQRELTDVTDQYDRLLRPLNDALDEINDKQQAIRDRQSTSAARKVLRDPASTANEKRLAQLDIEEIKLRQQMDVVEEERDTAVRAAQDKLKAAQKEVEVSQAIYNAQAALLEQTVETNRLIGEQNDLRKKQGEEAERLYQATLQYNLAIASTEGKLALLRLELARQKEGSVEYYGVLTQIAGLEKQLKDEQADDSLIPTDGVLPSLDELGIPQWADDLAKRLNTALKEALGINQPVPLASLVGPKEEGFSSMLDFQGEQLPEPEVSQQIKDFVENLKALTVSIQEMTPSLATLAEFFGSLGKASEESEDEVELHSEGIFSWIKLLVSNLTAIATGDWPTLWANISGSVKQELGEANEEGDKERSYMYGQMQEITGLIDALGRGDWIEAWRIFIDPPAQLLKTFAIWLGTWILDINDAVTGWLQSVQTLVSEWDLGEAGRAWIKSLWDGAKGYWEDTVVPWWESTALGKLVDQLPGSEPKDPSSPLAGLQDRGKAIIENLQLGIEGARLSLPEANAGLLAAGASSVATGSGSSTITIQSGAIQVNGINGADEIVPSLDEAFYRFLQKLKRET